MWHGCWVAAVFFFLLLQCSGLASVYLVSRSPGRPVVCMQIPTCWWAGRTHTAQPRFESTSMEKGRLPASCAALLLLVQCRLASQCLSFRYACSLLQLTYHCWRICYVNALETVGGCAHERREAATERQRSGAQWHATRLSFPALTAFVRRRLLFVTPATCEPAWGSCSRCG